MSDTRVKKGLEEMTTTASFVLTIGQVRWIEEQARRLGKNRSELVRDLLASAMADVPALVGERVA